MNQNNKKGLKILDELERIASLCPAWLYWVSAEGVVLGMNDVLLPVIGAKSKNELIGKTAYELYPKEMAEKILHIEAEVVRTGKTLSQEEPITNLSTGEVMYFRAIKAPLRDDDGNVIGIIGTSFDITAEKEAERLKLETERLKLENEAHKIELAAQSQFGRIANQVAHDIRSPLASLLMIVKSCPDIPENERVALREAAINIGDIANNLLGQYEPKEQEIPSLKEESREPILVSATLLQLLTDKKYQYANLPVKFNYDFSQAGCFAFIKIAPSSFKRMLSNLINNAVDAFENKPGRILLSLDVVRGEVKIKIQDNGKGMSQELISKILNNIAVTDGKEGGHGLGLMQVRETLQNNYGELSIDSTIGKGTIVTLTFNRIRAPLWIADEMILSPEDTVIVLDDDTSIHGAWDSHFISILSAHPTLNVVHFQDGAETLAFIEAVPEEEKKKIFLLSDYELLKQNLNGLQIIEQSKIKRTILVTSHYANKEIQERAAQLKTCILPKQLASDIPIHVDPKLHVPPAGGLHEPDMVIIDDDEIFARNVMAYQFKDWMIDHYIKPEAFLQHIEKYSKSTKFCLDKNFNNSLMDGVALAERLHALGFQRLYMISGEMLEQSDVPDYLIVLSKTDMAKLRES